MTNQMPYFVKLVNWPIESGSEVSWFSLRASLSKRAMRIEMNNQLNAVRGQVGQLANTVRYGQQLVVAEIESIKEGSETSGECLLNKTPHNEHARVSFDCKAVSRSFPYGFHSSSSQTSSDMLSERSGKRESPSSCNHQIIALTSHSRLDPPL